MGGCLLLFPRAALFLAWALLSRCFQPKSKYTFQVDRYVSPRFGLSPGKTIVEDNEQDVGEVADLWSCAWPLLGPEVPASSAGAMPPWRPEPWSPNTEPGSRALLEAFADNRSRSRAPEEAPRIGSFAQIRDEQLARSEAFAAQAAGSAQSFGGTFAHGAAQAQASIVQVQGTVVQSPCGPQVQHQAPSQQGNSAPALAPCSGPAQQGQVDEWL